MKKILTIGLLAITTAAMAVETVERSFYFDFGPVGRENAAAVANPDGNGNYWNNIGAEVTANPWKVSNTTDYAIVTAANAATAIHMGYTGDLFLGNGAGGWANPDAAVLGDLAVVNATRDYLFASNAERCGLVLTGLNPDKAYQFKIFGSRAANDARVSKYDIEGLTRTTGSLQAAGSGIGAGGVNQNTSNVYLSDKIFPDPTGKITIYVSKGTSGQYLPINCMRMQEISGVEKPFTGVLERSFYFDFGPVGRENAAAVANPDGNGNYWNNIGAEVTANPWKVSNTADYAIVTAANAATAIHMGYTGDLFLGNGAGGWANPDAAVLGDLAVVNATRDYLFASNAERCGLQLTGLDRTKAYIFKIFASRSASDARVSLYTLEGLTTVSGSLQVSGSNYGGTGVNQNVANVFVSDPLFPDATGKIVITVSKGASGQYLPINCMRMQEFSGLMPPVVTKYDTVHMKGTGVEDSDIIMHLVAKRNETEGLRFETFCTLTNGGTMVMEDKQGNTLYSGTVSVATGVYRVQYNVQEAAPVLTKINRIGFGGNVTSTGWSNSGLEMIYQGHGVWQSTLDLIDYTGTDAKRGDWYINNSWDIVAKIFENEEGKICISDEAGVVGFGTNDVFASPGRHLVTLDLRQFTYAFDCVEEVQDPLITFFGSSVCNGQGATDMHGYAYQYGHNKEGYRYLNNSINGNNTTNLLNRFYGNLIAACSDYVVIGLGLGNEGLHEAANKQQVYDQWKTNMQLLISKAQEAGMQVVATNNYPRGDYNAEDYGYVKRMNLEMHEWDIPTVNFLGALDNCQSNGQWADGHQVVGDIYHPTDAGHTQFMHAMVPSLFDALETGKAMPTRQTGEGLHLTATETLEFSPEDVLGAYAYAVRVKTTAAGVFLKTRLNGQLMDMSLPTGVNDGQWHTIVVSHYQAAGKTYTYVDGVLADTQTDSRTMAQFVLGGIDMQVSDLMFWRSALNADEVAAIETGKLLRSSLEIYCPLNNEALDNTAQSTNTILRKGTPTAMESIYNCSMNSTKYDVLGHVVGEDYKGIVIQNGQKTLK